MNEPAPEYYPEPVTGKCLYCDGEFEKKRDTQRFCSGKCRAGYHREQQATGTLVIVKGVRQLKGGGKSITIHVNSEITSEWQIGQLLRLHKDGTS